ncbi:hypothetical protein GCM10009743_67040 [Kribbella swartbergensis]
MARSDDGRSRGPLSGAGGEPETRQSGDTPNGKRENGHARLGTASRAERTRSQQGGPGEEGPRAAFAHDFVGRGRLAWLGAYKSVVPRREVQTGGWGQQLCLGDWAGRWELRQSVWGLGQARCTAIGCGVGVGAGLWVVEYAQE